LPFDTRPRAAAATKNLRCELEIGAVRCWRPSSALDAWRSELELSIGNTTFRELSEDEARQGYDGFLVTRALRPGVVEAFVFAPKAVDPAAPLRARQLPEAWVWLLDRAYYADLASQDLTRAPGASRLQLLETEGLAEGALLAFQQSQASAVEVAT